MVDAFAIPPGATIQEYIEYTHCPLEDFANRLGLHRLSLNRLIRGEQALTTETAQKLELITGVGFSFWVNLEANYRRALLREASEAAAADNAAWLANFPLNDLRRRGFLPPDFARLPPLEREQEVLRFFRRGSVQSLKEHLESAPYLLAARTTKGQESDLFSLVSWVQMGQVCADRLLADDRDFPAYDEQAFRKSIREAVLLSHNLNGPRYGVRDYLNEVVRLFRKAGVILICLEKIKGLNQVNGVARWMDNRPLIVLTLNGKQAHRMIFFLPHECSHVLNDGRRLVYVGRGAQTPEEVRANKFAAECLIPASQVKRLLAAGNLNALCEIASDLHVYTGVVVGQFRHARNCWRDIGFRQKTIDWKSVGSWLIGDVPDVPARDVRSVR